jgi:hypothetical protein
VNREAEALEAYLGALLAPEASCLSQAASWQSFTAGRLRFALPVDDCAGVMALPAGLRLPADSETVLFEHRDGDEVVKLVSLVRLVVHAGRRRGWAEPAPRQALRLRGGAVAVIGERFDGEPPDCGSQVIWRTTETRRPWLAGVDPAKGLILLDSKAILALAGAPSGGGMESAFRG